MTDPFAPAPGATPKQTAAAFAQKLMLASYQDFGTGVRPGLASALANGTADGEQIDSISGFVRALDVANQARNNANAGIDQEHSAEQQDLLNSVGESASIVKRANQTVTNTKDPQKTSQWFDNLGHTVAMYSANSGNLIFPQTQSFAGQGKTSDGSPQNPVTHALLWGLNQVGNFAGWLYRQAKEASPGQVAVETLAHAHPNNQQIQAAVDKLGITQRIQSEKALGYDPNNPLSDLAFQWNHGEAQFNDLSAVVQAYGQDHVNTALNVFYRMKGYGADMGSALGSYMQDLAQQVRDGKITPDQYVSQQKFIDSKEFEDVYNAVDREHVSFGRDLANLILPTKATVSGSDSPMFRLLSGSGDAALSMLADPTLLGGKFADAVKVARFGVDAMNGTRIAKVLGVADKITGAENKATALGNRVQGFLDSAKRVRDLTAEGDHVAAAAESARMSRTYSDLTPMLHEVNGNRLAITEEQRAAAAKAGTTMNVFGAEMPYVKSQPIETLDQFRDFLTDTGALNRYAKGAGAGTLRIMPGKVGPIAGTLRKIAGNVAANRVLSHANDVIDYVGDAGKIIPSDYSELFQQIAQAKGTEQWDALQGQLGVARRIKAQAEQMNRRVTSLLPFAKSISFNANDAGADIERLARLSLPKYEASILRYIWEQAPTEATRRAIGRGIVNSVNEAAGMTRSVLGRQILDRWNKGMDELDSRAYGFGETDRLQRADGSIGRAALHMSQIETRLDLPSFEEMRKVAAKASILGYDSRLQDGSLAEGMSSWFRDAQGNKDVAGGWLRMAQHPWRTAKYGLFFSTPVERAMSILKMGWLMTSSNALRQMSEEWLGLMGSGNRSQLVKGKRLLRLDNDTSRLAVIAHNLVPISMRPKITDENGIVQAVGDARYRIAMGDGKLTDTQRYALDRHNAMDVRPDLLEMYGARQAGTIDGMDVATAGHADGVPHTRIEWNGKGKLPERHRSNSRFVGYTESELNGDTGRAALSDNYGQRFQDPDEPALRALAYLMHNKAAEDPEWAAKLSPEVRQKMDELDPTKGTSTEAIKKYVAEDERTAVFRQRAEWLNTDEHGHVLAADDAAGRADAVERYVHNLIGDVAAAVYNHDAKSMHVPLVSDLLRSKIPSPADLAKISITNLPAHVIRAEFEPDAIGNVGKYANGFTAFMSKYYDKLVTNPMYRMIRKPLYTANFVDAREALIPWENQLVKEFGWDKEQAASMMDRLAEGQAMQETIKYIDNPRVRSQFSVIAQNAWLFYRAQEDWARRWARITRENPELIRKAHMAIMAGEQTGMIDRDANGNLIFSYPGSGLALEAMMHVGNAIMGKPGAQVPHVDDLTSQINFLNPALMNPLGFSATPALSVPFDLLANFIPGADVIKANADMAMQGQLGNGRQWWEQFMPTAIRRLIQLTPIDGSADNTGSTVGSAAATAVQNAALLGQLPTDGDAVKLQEFITNTQTQTLNALIARSLFSFFTPGAPSMPELYGNGPADFSYRAQGVRSLSDEFKAMTAQFGFNNALVMWQELHPDKMIITVGKTDASAKGASVDPTWATAEWIMRNKSLFEGPYKRVAAYFTPPAPGNFDQIGWNTMQAIGVRQYKDLTQYATDLISKNATTAWFDAKDDYDAAYAAVRNGDLATLEKQWTKEGLTDARKAQLRSIFSNAANSGMSTKMVDDAYAQKKTALYNQFPILHTYFAETTARKDSLRQMVNELTQMVQDPNVNLPDLPGVAQMLIVKDNYEKQSSALKGQRSSQSTAERQNLLTAYNDDLQSIVAKYPNLKDLYNGVFRYLEQ